MNFKSTFFSIIFICTGSTSILADEYQRGFSSSRTWEETVEVPCPGVTSTTNENKFDNNDCSEGTIAGGILGGGLATAISRGKDRWWAIPAGVIGGSMVGCEIDGG